MEEAGLFIGHHVCRIQWFYATSHPWLFDQAAVDLGPSATLSQQLTQIR